jgi:hypothetical protein
MGLGIHWRYLLIVFVVEWDYPSARRRDANFPALHVKQYLKTYMFEQHCISQARGWTAICHLGIGRTSTSTHDENNANQD